MAAHTPDALGERNSPLPPQWERGRGEGAGWRGGLYYQRQRAQPR